MTLSSFQPRLARLVLVSALAVPMAASAQTPAAATAKPAPAAKATAQKGLPPVLDRELFFGNPEIAGAQLSPDGKWTAFLKPWKETRNVWVKKTGDPYDKARLVTAEPKRPVAGFFWSRDGKYILFVKDKDGDENYNVWAVDPAATAEAGKDAPAARNLTAAKGARAQIYDVPKSDPDAVFVGLNDRDAAWHDLYRVKISTGERTLMRKNTEKISGWIFDLAGPAPARLPHRRQRRTPKSSASTPEGLHEDLLLQRLRDVRPDPLPQGRQAGLHGVEQGRAGPRGASSSSTRRPARKRPSRPIRRGASISATPSSPRRPTSSSPRTYEDEKTRIYFRNKEWEADYRLLQKKLPNREIIPAGATADDMLWIVTAYSDVDPGTRYLFDRKTKKLSARVRLPRAPPARAHGADEADQLQVLRRARDPGLPHPAEGCPREESARSSCFPHGGPWARDDWGYEPLRPVPREPRLRRARSRTSAAPPATARSS